MIILNPTGGNIRNDSIGSGYFHAIRSSETKGVYLHKGVDLEVAPWANVVAPVSGKIVRSVQVYPDTQEYKGCVIENADISIKLLYVKLSCGMVGKNVHQGEVIGKAQDISLRYPGATVHDHMEIQWINPLLLM